MTTKLIRTGKDGQEEIYYSEEYLEQQLKLAYQAGISYGIRVDIHAIQPMYREAVKDLTDEFYRNVRETYDKMNKDFHLRRQYSADFHRKMKDPTYKSSLDYGEG